MPRDWIKSSLMRFFWRETERNRKFCDTCVYLLHNLLTANIALSTLWLTCWNRDTSSKEHVSKAVEDLTILNVLSSRQVSERYNGSYVVTPMLIRRERFSTIGHLRNVGAGILSSRAARSAMRMRKLKAKTSNNWPHQIDCPLARWSHDSDREACPLRSGGSQGGRNRPLARWLDLSHSALGSTLFPQHH